MRRPSLAAGLVALGLLTPLAAAPAAAQQPERLALSGDRVELYDLVGRVRLHRGTGAAVVVLATRVGGDATALRFESDRNGRDGATRLRVVFPADRLGDGIFWAQGGSDGLRVRDDGTFGDDDRSWGSGGTRIRIGQRGGLHASADLDVAVPEGRTVVLHLAVGRADLAGTSGDFTIDTWGADVGAEDIAGTYRFDTGSGDVVVHGANGSLHFDTGSGDVTASGLRGALADFDTGSGDVDVTDVQVDRARFDTGSGHAKARGLQARTGIVDTGSGDAELEFTGGALDDWKIDTGSGDARITLPPGASVTITVDAGSGDLDVERAGVTMQGRQGDTKTLRVGDGRGRMRIDTGSGDVTIH